MPNTEPLAQDAQPYVVPADMMPLTAQFRQFERAAEHVWTKSPNWRNGIAPALAYIDAMQIRLTEMRQLLIELQSCDGEQP